MLYSSRVTEPSQMSPKRRALHQGVLDAGRRLAEEAGIAEPTKQHAVWEILMEAADTLKRLPDHEWRWLNSGTRAYWPDTLREYSETFAAAVARGGRWEEMAPTVPPSSPESIARLEIAMEWLRHAGGRSPRRNTGVVFALAVGIPVRVIRRRYGIARRTVYDIRDRGIGRICAWLESVVPFDEH